MCHFCHQLGYNLIAPAHRSQNCIDKRNDWSIKANYQGRGFYKYCSHCRTKTPHIMHCNNGYETPGPRCMIHT